MTPVFSRELLLPEAGALDEVMDGVFVGGAGGGGGHEAESLPSAWPLLLPPLSKQDSPAQPSPPTRPPLVVGRGLF